MFRFRHMLASNPDVLFSYQGGVVLKPWVRRLFRKDCFVCEGTGWTNPRYVNVDRLPCDACLGTGLRIVERAETNRERFGSIEERR